MGMNMIGTQIEIEVVQNGVLIKRNGGKNVFEDDAEAKLFILYCLHGAGATWPEFQEMIKEQGCNDCMADLISKEIDR